MALKAGTHPTLLDIAKRVDPNGRIEGIAELLTERNPVLMDMVVMEANQDTSHQTTVRTGWPTPAWSKLNYGVTSQKSTTRQITFECGMLKQFSEVSAELIEKGGKTEQWRASEEIAFIESMNVEMAETLFYGDTSENEASFNGLSMFYNDKSAKNGSHIIDAGGTGDDNRSIWIIGWGPMSVFAVHPKGWPAGLEMVDLGKYLSQTAPVEGSTDANGRMFVYGTHYKWSMGIVLKDWRYAVRIANIDKSDLTKDASSGADLIEHIIRGLNRMHDLTSVRPAIYADRSTIEMLDLQDRYAVDGSTLEKYDYGDGVFGRSARGVPIRYCDALDVNESRVT